MNKEELKQLIFDNFTPHELYEIKEELAIIKKEKELNSRPTLNEIFEQAKQLYQIDSYIKVVPHQYKGDNYWSEHCSSILHSDVKGYDLDVMYAKITDLRIVEHTDENGDRNNRVVLHYDFIQFTKNNIEQDDFKLKLDYNITSKGKGKIYLADEKDRVFNDFEFEMITEQEYNQQIEIANNILKQF